jgi:hypothetical protein
MSLPGSVLLSEPLPVSVCQLLKFKVQNNQNPKSFKKGVPKTPGNSLMGPKVILNHIVGRIDSTCRYEPFM